MARTPDIKERPLSLEQNAEDIIGLPDHLGLTKATHAQRHWGGRASADESPQLFAPIEHDVDGVARGRNRAP
jgi:hypothetical protein